MENESGEFGNISVINSLPQEFLMAVFGYFHQRELATVIGTVCKKWHRIAHQLPNAWKCAIICEMSSEEAVQYLNQHSRLVKEVKFIFRDDTDVVLKNINMITKHYIQSLNFSICDDILDTIEEISRNKLAFPNLQILQLTFNRNEVERYLTALPKLKLKKVGVCNFGGADLGDFAAFCLEGLTSLSIDHLEDEDEADIPFNGTPRNPEIANMELRQGLLNLVNSCEYLQIFSNSLTDSAIEVISKMKQLKGLQIMVSSLISKRCLHKLRNLEHLEMLYVDDRNSVFSEEEWVEFFKSCLFKKNIKKFALYEPSGLRINAVKYIKKNCSGLADITLLGKSVSAFAFLDVFYPVRKEWLSLQN